MKRKKPKEEIMVLVFHIFRLKRQSALLLYKAKRDSWLQVGSVTFIFSIRNTHENASEDAFLLFALLSSVSVDVFAEFTPLQRLLLTLRFCWPLGLQSVSPASEENKCGLDVLTLRGTRKTFHLFLTAFLSPVLLRRLRGNLLVIAMSARSEEPE